jgi:23S rRNA (adenine2030-N6)-methyltransferase
LFSYRHAFHAANHADVLKHIVLVHLLDYLGTKPTPYWVIDTHAGAGVYALDGEWASKRGEFIDGIARLWSRNDAPHAVNEYLDVVRSMNPDGMLRYYPGSPFIALHFLRDKDRLRLFEFHRNESLALARNIGEAGGGATRKTLIDAADGFVAVQALLPPPPRRGLVLIDPSYEDKRDYSKVVSTLKGALTRFATGSFAIWYPQVQRRDSFEMVRKLSNMTDLRWLHASLTVRRPSADGLGLHGSGMFVINPCWTLEAAMHETLPWLANVLAQDSGAGWTLESNGL